MDQTINFFYAGNLSFFINKYENLIRRTKSIIIDSNILPLLLGPVIRYNKKIVIYTHMDCEIPGSDFFFIVRLR